MQALRLMTVMLNLWFLLTTLLVVDEVLPSNSSSEQPASNRPGIQSGKFGNCPRTHPIKGNFTTYSGEPCIYHLPEQQFYKKTRAERCYATEADARQDGCRKSKR